MKCNVLTVVMGLFIAVLLGLAGCGGGGGSTTNSESNSLITSVGCLFNNAAPDFSNNGPTCYLSIHMYYNESISADDIDSLRIIAPNGWQWPIPVSSSQSVTNSSGKPYISINIYYGAVPQMMPLAGTWIFQLKLKDGQISSIEKTLHEPGSAANATHQYVYAAEDWSPWPDTSQYIAALGRFPAQGYTLQYSIVNGGVITSTGLAAIRASFLTAQPHAYNMICLLYDGYNTYLGQTIPEFSPQDHSRTDLITANGELLITSASTVSKEGLLNLSDVRYLRFVYFDGAQYEPSSYSKMDYRSISPLVGVFDSIALSLSNAPVRNSASQPFTASDIYTDNVMWGGAPR